MGLPVVGKSRRMHAGDNVDILIVSALPGAAMWTTRALAVCVLTLSAADFALAAETLPLGSGTACVLMSEREAKATLGVKKRHVLACAGPSGAVVRVVITRKGTVECTDSVQVAADGSKATLGAACRGVAPSRRATIPPVVNISGSWRTYVDSLIGLVTCVSQVDQDGSSITIHAACDVGDFAGTGTIDFEGSAFSSRGDAQVPVFGYCSGGEMTGTVAADGQSMTGTLACGGFVVTYSATRD